ncbi:SRP9/SRP21 family protein [Aspergillus melleus]|uniref:SRP9/SRP21 family protein n=1 Tax=Aspergillus melleus TaxID=138277 RepID=UPI001E8CBA13|nr:uncharacterized protein LDX57_004894 [Aspergillus melleus]KAH8427179.1 hypothetical protein LDX57_004894 [Aspergillus melleus]
MPYLPTPQAYLEQSALLLEAYPDTTRITTKYSFPSHKPKSTSTTDAAPTDPQSQQSQTTTTPVATLTLKTFNPSAGLCLKYRTNKAAEVGRLITSLGKLAGGADVASLGLGAAAAAAPAADVEMADAPEDGTATPTTAAAAPAAKTESSNKGGKSKKKGGKGKR